MKIKFKTANIEKTCVENPLFGNEKIKVTNLCLFRDGKPWLPIMGEMQFSRVKEKDWRKSLRLMKEGGIDIVASYVFWNHHEEEKGEFRFDGNLNIRKFVEMCAEEGLYFFLRIGPWVHGEARNGGLPDWLVKECAEACKGLDMKFPNIGVRFVVEPYMSYVKKYMYTIYDELKDLQEHIIGIQMDNEVYNNPEYLAALKQITLEAGMKVPLYTATAWAANLAGTGLLPMEGGYPDDSGSRHTEHMKDSAVYSFEDPFFAVPVFNMLDEGHNIKNELIHKLCPNMTCELGSGIQITYHRRPRIEPEDIYSMAVCYLGKETNLLGFYVYHGGYNPIGKYTTLQESMESGYPLDYSIISYDFQAPLGDVGQIRKHYFMLKEIFDFCHEYGEILAPMRAVISDSKIVRSAVRSDGEKGFLFVNNHKRVGELDTLYDIDFEVEFEKKNIEIHFDEIPAGASFYLPLGFEFGNLKTKYVTAKLRRSDDSSVTFMKIPGIKPVLCLENGKIVELEDGVKVNGVEILLEEPLDYKVSQGVPLEAKASVQNQYDFCYFKHLGLEDKTKEYTIKFNSDTKFVKIYWMGNVAVVYADGKFMCDQYYHGRPWVLDVSEVIKKEITIKIQPLSEDDVKNIYFAYEAIPGDFVPEAEGFFGEYIYV